MITTGCTRLAFQLGLILVAARSSSVSATLIDERTYVLENGVEGEPRFSVPVSDLSKYSIRHSLLLSCLWLVSLAQNL